MIPYLNPGFASCFTSLEEELKQLKSQKQLLELEVNNLRDVAHNTVMAYSDKVCELLHLEKRISSLEEEAAQ